MQTFKLNVVVMALLAAGAASAQTTTELNKVTVTGEGDKLGTGLLMEEDAPKARSSVTKAQLDKTRSSGNPFQALSLLPGVNTSSYDATGIFGGNLRVRGFNSDQMGFTVNGAPVNDSGSFSVFPQEYIDQENLCSLYITQGAPDTDAPHVGATGGNVGLQSCAPEDKRRVRVSTSAGQLDYLREYIRFDTGLMGGFKAFGSYSYTSVDKWKGPGNGKRDHVDLGADYDFGAGNKVTANLLFNRNINNNFATLNQTQWATLGYFADFSKVVPQHRAPVNGVSNDGTPAQAIYYGYSINPFENYLLTAKGSFTLTDRLRLDVTPYYWYGYGTGGNEQAVLTEGGTTGNALLHGGIGDLNGDGDRRDSVLVYRGSLTQTHRPGIIGSLTYVLDNQKINGGVWIERANHRQTQPAVTVDNAGNISDIWLGGNLLNYADGTTYQGRNQKTISTAGSVFIQDTVDLFDNKLQITPAVSYRKIKRDFVNYANSGSSGGGSGSVDYQIDRTYGKVLPSLAASFQATDRLQVFSSLAQNFKVPGNFDYQNLATGVTFVNGVGTATGQLPLTVRPETSVNFDLGTRYRGDMFRASATAFYNRFKDRIASSYDVVQNITHDFNVGNTKTKGVEIEAGTVPFHGFSGYASLTYTQSTIDNNLALSGIKDPVTGIIAVTGTAPTAGKIFPDTPKQLAGLSLQWADGPYLAQISGKYQSLRYLTLTNDTQIPAFTTFDFNAAYKLPNFEGFGWKNMIVRLNSSNIFNRHYFFANAGSGSNVTITNGGATGGPFYYAGAPRFTSVTFQADY